MLGIRITRCRKLYVGGLRLHHGRVGGWLVALGALLMFHDRLDAPWPWRD